MASEPIWTRKPVELGGFGAYWIRDQPGSNYPGVKREPWVAVLPVYWQRNGHERSTAPIESAEQLADLRAKAAAGEALAEAVSYSLADPDHGEEEIRAALRAYEALGPKGTK